MNTKIGRNEPCPCGSGKKFKKCCRLKQISAPSFSWLENDGFHFAAPGPQLSPEQLKKMTKEYQKQIRNSPMWDEMVRKFGKDKAEELLRQCQAKAGQESID